MTVNENDLAAAGMPAVTAKAVVAVVQATATEVNQDVVDTANEALATAEGAETTAGTAATAAAAALVSATANATDVSIAEADIDTLEARMGQTEIDLLNDYVTITSLNSVVAALEARIVSLESGSAVSKTPSQDDLVISTTAPIVGVVSPSQTISPPRRDLLLSSTVPTVMLSSGHARTPPNRDLLITGTAPTVQSSSVVQLDTMTATFTGLPVGTVIFTENTAADGGSYAAPSGAFVQQHRIATNTTLPGVKVHFARDQASGRREVWVYYGRMNSLTSPPADLGASTLTIREGGTTLKVQAFARFPHRRWWRWPEGGPRAAVTTIAALVAAHKLPPIDLSIPVQHAGAEGGVNYAWPEPFLTDPFTDTGLMSGMSSAGERNEIGLFTSESGKHIYTSSNFNNVLVQAEMAAQIPYHYIDESTGCPVSIYDQPDMTLHTNETGEFGFIWQSDDELFGTWNIDVAHNPNLLGLAGLLTEDPFYTLLAQGVVTWWFTRFNRWPSGFIGTSSVGPNWDAELRGEAWRYRDYVTAWLLTPDSVPSAWMQPRSYFTNVLTGTAAWLRQRWITSPASITAQFHLTKPWTSTPEAHTPIFQESFMANVMAYWAWVGAPGSVLDLFTWKVDLNIALCAGRGGWPRQYAGTGWVQGFDNNPATWGQVYTNTGWTPPVGELPQYDPNQDPPNGTDFFYANYQLAALEWARAHGISSAELTAGVAWLRDSIGTWNQFYSKWTWRV